ncbi:MAG: esterase-like activity of phytase family protein [Chthoniobacterales bacterium]
MGGQQIGGLSSLGYDKKSKQLVAASDARRKIGSVLWFFDVDIDKSKKLRVVPERFVVLEGASLDVEGLALATKNRIFLAYDEANDSSSASGISCFNKKSGQKIFSLPLPEIFESKTKSGLQKNRGLESLSLSPDRQILFAASESPLLQDSEDGHWAGPIRVLRYDLQSRETPPRQCVYLPDESSAYNTLVEILALKNGRLLMLERTLVENKAPRHVRARVYEVDFFEKNATPAESIVSLRETDYTPLSKKLVFDSEKAHLDDIDNVEGMSFGPTIDKKISVFLVSDNNFRKDQKTEFLLFSVRE